MKSKGTLIYRTFLIIAVIFLAILCVQSVVTPIKFEEKRLAREAEVIKNLVYIRTAENEFKTQNGRYTADMDSLLLFLKTTPKKEVFKQGSLTEKQLEDGLTEHKAVLIIKRAKEEAKKKLKTSDDAALTAYIEKNNKEIISRGLVGFRRDTIDKNMIEELYKGTFNEQTIDQIAIIPFTDGQRFELEVNDSYSTSQGIRIPLFEARAHYNTYLADLNKQERINLIDKQIKLDKYPGLKVGDVTAPNNNAGNWE